MSLHGTVYPLPPLAPRTSVTGSSGSPLLPTPRQDPRDATARTPREDWRPSLGEVLLQQGGTAAEATAYRRILGDLPPTPTSGEPTDPPSSDGKKSPAPLLNPCFVAWMLGMPEEWSDPDSPLTATAYRCRLGFSSENGSSSTREAA
jgi:hypothetical protein